MTASPVAAITGVKHTKDRRHRTMSGRAFRSCDFIRHHQVLGIDRSFLATALRFSYGYYNSRMNTFFQTLNNVEPIPGPDGIYLFENRAILESNKTRVR